MKRENNIDLLKIVACIMVISIHVSAFWVDKYLKEDNYKFLLANFWDALSQVAVPTFVMIAGRYALSNEKNINYKMYYEKILKNIYIPTFIWSFLYIVYNYLIEILAFFIKGKEIELFSPIKSFLIGCPAYHLWYLYMMIATYLTVPFLIKFRKKYGNNKFFQLGIIFVFIGLGVVLTKLYLKNNFFKEDYFFEWLCNLEYLKFINYMGYFILGYCLKNKKINIKKSLSLYLFSLLALILIVERTRNLFYYNHNFIFIFVGTLSLYLFFNNINLRYDFSKLEKHTFNIYLVHAGILTSVFIFLTQILNYEPDIVWYIPLTIVVIFLISLSFSVILEKVLNKIKNKSTTRV